jgi:hypothetical protein
MRKFYVQWQRYSFTWLVLVPFIILVIFVNPLREMALEDDWAYSLTVRHLTETGSYQLNNWLAANMPFQAYWGLIVTRVIGYSHSSLHISTLVLAHSLAYSPFTFWHENIILHLLKRVCLHLHCLPVPFLSSLVSRSIRIYHF